VFVEIVKSVQTGIMVESVVVDWLIEKKRKLDLFCLQPLTSSEALLQQPKASL